MSDNENYLIIKKETLCSISNMNFVNDYDFIIPSALYQISKRSAIISWELYKFYNAEKRPPDVFLAYFGMQIRLLQNPLQDFTTAPCK